VHFSRRRVRVDVEKGGFLSLFWVEVFGFWFLVCDAATQLATQLPQRRIQVVRSNKAARKRLTGSKGTPAMDFGNMNVG